MNAEKIKVLAEKVMGWVWKPYDVFPNCASCWHKDGKAEKFDFDPYTNSADNDALVEAFVGNGFTVTVIHSMGHFVCDVIKCGSHVQTSYAESAKKNEAVCEAIYKAVTV